MDIRLAFNQHFQADIQLDGFDIATDRGLETAVIISLFSDRRASDDDVLPPADTDKRGWWGDTEMDKIGSRLWLLSREKQMPQVLAKANEYAREALKWMIDDNVASHVDVIVESHRFEMLAIQVNISRKNGKEMSYRYNYAWQAQAVRMEGLSNAV